MSMSWNISNYEPNDPTLSSWFVQAFCHSDGSWLPENLTVVNQYQYPHISCMISISLYASIFLPTTAPQTKLWEDTNTSSLYFLYHPQQKYSLNSSMKEPPFPLILLKSKNALFLP